MLQRILLVITIIISAALLLTTGDSNQERPVRDRKKYSRPEITKGYEQTSNFRSDRRTKTTALALTSNFKRPQHGSSNEIHTQKVEKQPKQKVKGVPSGILASGYFLISAWTNVGCTGRCLTLLHALTPSSHLISIVTDD